MMRIMNWMIVFAVDLDFDVDSGVVTDVDGGVVTDGDVWNTNIKPKFIYKLLGDSEEDNANAGEDIKEIQKQPK